MNIFNYMFEWWPEKSHDHPEGGSNDSVICGRY